MKILVTGGAGFIGSNFICRALAANHHIINIDKLTYAGHLENLDAYQTHANHHFHQLDICNTKDVAALLQNHQPDIVLHMAAESHVDRSIDGADEFLHTNVLGTHSMLESTLKYYQTLSEERQKLFRFIHLSTDEVFGALGHHGSFTEKTPYAPSSPYAASKAASDFLVRSYHRTFHLPIIIINCSNNFGPKQYPEKLIPLMILNALEGKALPVYGEGKQIRDWLYVDDHIDALLMLLTKGKSGESYCIGGSNEITNLDLVEELCRILDEMRPAQKPYKNLITFVKDRPGHDFRYATDCSKIKAEIGWSPKTDFKTALRNTVKWYVDNHQRLKDPSARQRIGLRT